MNDKTKAIFNFLKESPDADYTADDISTALGINNTRSVNASITSGFVRHDPPLAERVPAQVQMEDGKWKDVKVIKLTDAGKDYDPEEHS